jgi:hypothetical protein
MDLIEVEMLVEQVEMVQHVALEVVLKNQETFQRLKEELLEKEQQLQLVVPWQY